ncbi:MAG: diaminopimelate decarboxylase [Desulfomonilaceae bacterium]
MHHFKYKNEELFCEKVPVNKIVDEFGTPLFIYSSETLQRHFKVFKSPFSAVPHLICFSMKACSNLTILKIFANLGGGVDIVSGGELYRALKADVPPSRIVYSGVGKQVSEIDYALRSDILMFNVESEDELELLNKRSMALGKIARIAMRVNPDVDALTHPYISTGLKSNKFGVPIEKAKEIYLRANELPGLDPVGIDCHIGSQLTELAPFLEAVSILRKLLVNLRNLGINIKYLDIGGGLGIPYDHETPPAPGDYGAAILDLVSNMDITLIMEPGRVLVGNAGIMITRVLYKKSGPNKNFVIVDAAMNDLIRPSLYKAYHSIIKVKKGPERAPKVTVDIVGPICESGDFLARGREIEEPIPGELLAVMSAGAYGFSMSSNYNSRPRCAEVLVDGSNYYLIRQRETYEDLIKGEKVPDHIVEGK